MRLMASLLSLSAILALAGAARAEPDGSPDAQRAQLAQAFTARMEAALHLSPAQKAALNDYVSYRPPPAAGTLPMSAEALRALATQQRNARLLANIESDLAIVKGRSEAFDRFYGLLSPDQQQRFEVENASAVAQSETAPRPEFQPRPYRPDLSLPSHVDADWLRRPTDVEVSRVYPSLAMQRHITGNVGLSCLADQQGYLKDCVVASETPEGFGFGNAALEITAYMRMRPATNYGIPVKSRVAIPVGFKL